MYRPFQGPNGWYVAWVDDQGFHWQPQYERPLSERHARRLADEKNAAEADIIPDDDDE